MKRNLNWTFLKSPITIEEIHQLEDYFGRILPEGYKEILLAYNGGRPNRRKFQTKESKDLYIKTFLPITKQDGVNLYVVWDWLRFPKSIIPFASTPSGDYICFDYFSEVASPAIIFWNHEQNRKELISLQFDRFIEELH